MSRFLRGYPRQPQYLGPVGPGQKIVSVGQAVETDIALGRHKIAVGQATETDTSQHVMTPIKVHVGQAVETDTVPGITTPVFDPVVDWGVFIDWYGDGDFETDGDDVTGRTLARTEMSMQYGRDQARESSPMAAGRISFELDNRSKDYSPDNQDSPLYGQVLPARPLMIQATMGDQYLNLNPFFETNVDNWTAAGSATVAWSSAVLYPGATGSMKITPNGVASACGAGSELVTVTGGAAYTASAWMNSPGGYDNAHVLINWYTSGDVFISTSTGLQYTLDAGVWTEFGERFIAPTNAAKAAVWVWQAGTPAASDVWYSWGVKLAPASAVNTLFRGFTDEFTVQPEISDRSVAITGLDSVAKLQGVKATTQLYSGVRTGTAIGLVLDAIGWPTNLRDLDPGATVVRWWWVQDTDAFEAIQDLVTSEGPPAMLHADDQGRIVFRDRHHRLFNTASTTPQATFYSSTDDGEPAFSEFSYDHGWREVINSVSIKVDEIDPADQQQVWQNEGIVTIGTSQTLTLQLNLDAPVIEPSLEFDIINGSCSGSITIDSGQTITIALTAGAGGATITNLEVVGQPVTTSRSYTVLLEDADSISKYGKRSQDYTIPWAGYNDALAVGQLILDASSTRRPIVTVKMISGTWFASERLTQQLSRDLSDRVHVRELDQTCVDHDFHIEQIQHTASEGGLMLATEFGLERALEQAVNVFRFNDSTYGFDNGVFASVALADPAKLFRFDTTGQGFNDGVFAT